MRQKQPDYYDKILYIAIAAIFIMLWFLLWPSIAPIVDRMFTTIENDTANITAAANATTGNITYTERIAWGIGVPYGLLIIPIALVVFFAIRMLKSGGDNYGD